MNATRWLVLDNLAHHWPYSTGLLKGTADEAYLWCVNNEYIRDGKLTHAGRAILAACGQIIWRTE